MFLLLMPNPQSSSGGLSVLLFSLGGFLFCWGVERQWRASSEERDGSIDGVIIVVYSKT